MHRLARLSRLPTVERRLLIEATLLLGAIRPGLRQLPFQTVRRLLSRVAREPAGPSPAIPPSTEQIVWAVTVAGRYVPKVGTGVCLTEALAAQTMLARRELPALLRIRLIKGEESRLQAHAWVESGGEVVIGGGPDLDRFTTLPTPEGDGP